MIRVVIYQDTTPEEAHDLYTRLRAET